MIILDTNVVSEFMGEAPLPAVQEWLNRQNTTHLFLSTVTIAEITFGLAVLPEGRRRLTLMEEFERVLATAFQSRVLPFDEVAARIYGNIRAGRKQAGRPMSALDGQIAAIARSRGFTLATRNVRDFVGCGVELINPFEPAD